MAACSGPLPCGAATDLRRCHGRSQEALVVGMQECLKGPERVSEHCHSKFYIALDPAPFSGRLPIVPKATFTQCFHVKFWNNFGPAGPPVSQ